MRRRLLDIVIRISRKELYEELRVIVDNIFRDFSIEKG